MKCIRMRGKKGESHNDPQDPPRTRANKTRGHGTWKKDRPPIQGIVGRESGMLRLEVEKNSRTNDLEPNVLTFTKQGATINTDKWKAYNRLSEKNRVHKQISHKPDEREWARDDDGDGIREVHNNTIEGIWTGVRNYLRMFRGVNKEYLQQYVSMFEWMYRLETATSGFIRILCACTRFPT